MSQPLYRDGHVYLLDKRHGLTCFELVDRQETVGRRQSDDAQGRNPQATLVWLERRRSRDRAQLGRRSDSGPSQSPRATSKSPRPNIIGRTWAHPGYAGNCVYARSDTEIVCVLLPVDAD